MNATQRLLESWWKARNPDTVKAAADRLGVRPTAIANYRAGVSQATPAVIEKMAVDLGEDAGRWLAQVEAERTHNERDRRAWAALARRLGAAAALGCIVALPAANVAQIVGNLPSLPIMSSGLVVLAGLAWWSTRTRQTA